MKSSAVVLVASTVTAGAALGVTQRQVPSVDVGAVPRMEAPAFDSIRDGGAPSPVREAGIELTPPRGDGARFATRPSAAPVPEGEPERRDSTWPKRSGVRAWL